MSKKEDMVLNEEIEAADVVEAAEENKEGAKKPVLKSVVARCITAVICTALVANMVSGGIKKYAEAITPAENAGSTESGDTWESGDSTDSYAPVDEGGSSDAAPSDADVPADAPADSDAASTDADATAPADSDADKTPAASEMSKAQIIAMFNNAANGAKSNAKSIKQNYCKNTQNTELESGKLPGAVVSVANKLISSNMGEDESKHDAVYEGVAKKDNFHVNGQTWSSKLTEADVKSAEIKEVNGGYEVVIKLIDDTQYNLKAGEGHAGKAISLVTKEQIVEGAGSIGMKFIKEDSIKVGHSGVVIKAKINKDGKLTAANYYRNWSLALTAVGIDVSMGFGIEEDYVINW